MAPQRPWVRAAEAAVRRRPERARVPAQGLVPVLRRVRPASPRPGCCCRHLPTQPTRMRLRRRRPGSVLARWDPQKMMLLDVAYIPHCAGAQQEFHARLPKLESKLLCGENGGRLAPQPAVEEPVEPVMQRPVEAFGQFHLSLA